jgi:hypothetical protein
MVSGPATSIFTAQNAYYEEAAAAGKENQRLTLVKNFRTKCEKMDKKRAYKDDLKTDMHNKQMEELYKKLINDELQNSHIVKNYRMDWAQDSEDSDDKAAKRKNNKKEDTKDTEKEKKKVVPMVKSGVGAHSMS